MTRKISDHDLWLEMTRTIKPLAQKKSSPAVSPKPLVSPHSKPKPPRFSSSPFHIRSTLEKSAPPITGLDRRTTQKLTRGQVEIDGRIDLHGNGIEQARAILERFLEDAQSRGLRTVLVITGKGDSPFSKHTLHGASHFHVPERAGRLRQLATSWFHEPEFRRYVAGFQPAHPRHGGGGAYYVRIRRIREDR